MTYYSQFILSSSNTDPEKFNVRDKEDLKDVLFNINRRRIEIKRCTDMYSSMKVTAEDKAALVEQVRKNTKVIFHLKQKAADLMDQRGMTPDDLWNYIEGHNLRNFDIDPSEIDVSMD